MSDGALGRWALKLGVSAKDAQGRYEAATGRSFLYLPPDARSLLTMVERDWGNSATAFWDAVVAHRWTDAVRALRTLLEPGDERYEDAIMLVERSIETGELPSPAAGPRRAPAPRPAGGGTIVIAKPFGRLANRLILFAHFIGAALEHDLQIVNPAFGEYADSFPAISPDLLCRFPPQQPMWASEEARAALVKAARAGARELYRRQTDGGDVGLIQIEIDEFVDLNGKPFLDMVRRHGVVLIVGWFFRNADNCARHRDAIREFFTPHREILDRAHAPVTAARRGGRPVVGVHIRRGDYAKHLGGRYYFSHATYRRIMELLAPGPDGGGATFFVSSDEPIPPEAFAGIPMITGSGRVLEDLYSLAACDFLIGPPSTFSRWASYYGGVPVFWLQDAAAMPSYDQFSPDRGLGWGAAKTRWVDPASAYAPRP